MLKDRRVRAATISILVEMSLVAIKLWGAQISQSRGLRADAFHSLSDIGVSSLVLLSVLAARRLHKWGKAVEEGTAFVIGVIISAVALGLLRPRAAALPREALQQLPAAIVLTWLCILISYFISKYKLRVGEECNSPNLRADGHHSRMDMYSSIAVLIGLVGTWSGLDLDTVAAVIVGLLILRIGIVVLAAALQNALRPEGHIADAVDRLESARTWVSILAALCTRAGFDSSLLERYAAAVRDSLPRYKRLLCVFALALLLIGYASTGFYAIAPDQLGVLTQFGRLTKDAVTPGLHYRLPPPFSRLYRAKPERAYQIEFGFRTVGQRGTAVEPEAYLWESQHQSGLYEKRLDEAILLTGDKNEVDLNLTIEYRLTPETPSRFYFKAGNPEAVIRALAQQCMQQVAGITELTTLLTTARSEIEGQLVEALQPKLDDLALGVRITAARLQDVHPPTPVVSAFRAVAAAREEKSTIIHKAEAYQNETLPQARGYAAAIKDDAEAYVDEKRLYAQGDAAYFTALVAAYAQQPDAVRFLRYVTTLEGALQSARLVLFDKDVAAGAAGSRLSEYFLGTEFLKSAPQGTTGAPFSTYRAPEESDDESEFAEEEGRGE